MPRSWTRSEGSGGRHEALKDRARESLPVDLYELLGVRRGAGPAEIRRAYQKRARQLHPDLNPGDPVAAERFRAVSLAFEVLSDPHRRSDYDRGGLRVEPPPPTPEIGFEGFDFSAELRVGNVGFRDLFDGVLASREGAAPEPAKGEDLEQLARITFEESLRGTDRRIQLVRAEECPVCRGAGDVAFGPVTCPRCEGTGHVRGRRGHMIFKRRCADCEATGTLRRRPCQRCGGEGRLMRSEWIEVRIPAGAADGTRVSVPGAGNAGRRGGTAGDLVLVVSVEPDPVFRREGDDLHCVVPVTMTEAALGAHVEVPTPDGPVPVEIPAGTQTGQRFRLRKRGTPRVGGSQRGDLYVEARVVIPAVTDDRSRALLREVAQRNPSDPRKDMAAACRGRGKA